MTAKLTDEQRAKRTAEREAKTRQNMVKVFASCADSLRRLYLPEGDPNRHPDADRTWAECSMQTRAALALAKAHGENPEADVKALFGIIVVQGRSKNAVEWERKALQVEAEQKQRAIDVLAVVKKDEAAK